VKKKKAEKSRTESYGIKPIISTNGTEEEEGKETQESF